MTKLLTRLLKLPIKLWRRIPRMPHCRFYPSCSRYFLLALAKYGPYRGFIKGISRILRCNPFSKGGVDLP